tara:strand:- start:12210 stop:12335 length:126 start_codon:yes stop_codon:yes gene_type:complete
VSLEDFPAGMLSLEDIEVGYIATFIVVKYAWALSSRNFAVN